MIDYLFYSYIEYQHFHDSPYRNQFSCLIDEILINQDVSFPKFLIMGICPHVNYYRVLRNLLLIALTSVVLRYSTPVLPFFILEAEPLIFVKLVSIRSLPSHSLFMVLGPPVKVQVRIYQPYAAVKTQGRDRDSFTQQISMTKLDQSEFFQGHFSLLFNVPFILALRSSQNVCLVPPEGFLSTI